MGMIVSYFKNILNLKKVQSLKPTLNLDANVIESDLFEKPNFKSD